MRIIMEKKKEKKGIDVKHGKGIKERRYNYLILFCSILMSSPQCTIDDRAPHNEYLYYIMMLPITVRL